MRTVFLLVTQMGTGGQERFVATLSDILKDFFNVVIVTIMNTPTGYSVSCPVINLQSETRDKEPSVLKRILLMKKLYAKYKPHACVSFGIGANRLNIEAKTVGVKSYISIRGYSMCERYSRFGWEPFFLHLADGVICVSDEIRDRFVEMFPRQYKKIYRLYNAYDVDKIANDVREIPKLSEQDGNIHLISLGRICKEKGYWHLLKAFKLILEIKPNTILDIWGYIQDNSLYQKLCQLCKELSIEQNVSFCGNSHNPYQEIARHDILVLSSIMEGFPNVLVESMACGVPVVSTDCSSGPREILDYQGGRCIDSYVVTSNGLLTPNLSMEFNFDPSFFEEGEKSLAAAVIAIINDELLKNGIKENAYNRAREFSYSTCLERFQEIIDNG